MDFETAEIAARKRNRLALWSNRAKKLYEAAESVVHLDGEFWECGVYQGGSAKLISELLRDQNVPHVLRLFDTFEGFTGISPEDEGSGEEGEMKYWPTVAQAVEDIRNFIGENFVSIHPGAVPRSFAGLENSKIAYAYLDMDLYYPTREAMKFLLPRMVPGGIIVIDDCGDYCWPGVEKAVNETKGNSVFEKFSFSSPDGSSYVGWQGQIRHV